MESPPPISYQLSPRTVLRLSGPDRQRYLNGQVTQDVDRATKDDAVYACVLNAKGKLEGVCYLREHEESYLIDSPLELREDLFARLDRYIIADDVELTDESDHWHISHTIGGTLPEDHLAWRTTRLSTQGFDLFSREAISVPGSLAATHEDFQQACTRNGIPSWGTELVSGLLPPEAGLDLTAISYQKGCYLGQEVISRIKHAGKVNQYLTKFSVPEGTRLPCSLLHNENEAGHLTSLAKDGSPRPLALGFRKRRFAEVNEFAMISKDGEPQDGVATAL
jgi:folate-binding protein YgfZ